MCFKCCVLLFIGLIQADDFNHDFLVEIPSYDEYSEWEPLPTFIFDNPEIRTDKPSHLTLVTEEKQEKPSDIEIENVLLILEDIKERLENIKEPIKAIKEHLNEKIEPLNEKTELKEENLPEIKESLQDAGHIEVINEPLEDSEKDNLERDCFKDDEHENELHYAGPVKAKGAISIGANFGHESPYPISHPYFPPFFYPLYYPYYLPYYLPPPDYQELYLEFLKKYYGIPSKHEAKSEMEPLPDCNHEESKVASYWQAPGENEHEVGKTFGGFVPVNGRISIAAHF